MRRLPLFLSATRTPPLNRILCFMLGGGKKFDAGRCSDDKDVATLASHPLSHDTV